MAERKLKLDWLIFVVPILIIDAITLLIMGIIRVWSPRFLSAIPKVLLIGVTGVVLFVSVRRFRETRDWYVFVLAIAVFVLALLLLK